MSTRSARGEDWVPTSRSATLSRRASRDTLPEILLRKALHRAGLRFRLHRRIPGERLTIDIVLPKHRLAVFVDGCFWHGGCELHPRNEPTGPNADRWRAKFDNVAQRERRAARRLAEAGWSVLRVRECDVKAAPEAVAAEILHLVKGTDILARYG
jgi:DNA mismatch endonuclease (patch repair protein)